MSKSIITNQASPIYLKAYDFCNHIEQAFLEPMMVWLCLGQPLRTLDTSCGQRLPAPVRAAQRGRTVGGQASLPRAQDLLISTEYVEAIEFQHSQLLDLAYADETFDLVWASYVLHHIADKSAAVQEMQRVLKPEGQLAIREDWQPLQMLPRDIGLGEPGLQDRLQIAQERWAAAVAHDTLDDEVPYPYRWSQLLQDAGFQHLQAQTLSLYFRPPFTSDQSEFVLFQIERMLKRDQSKYGPLLRDSDRAVLQRLLDPEDKHYVLKHRDLQIRCGCSVYAGQKSK